MKFVAVILISITLYACQRAEKVCLKKAGDRVISTLPVDSFTGIEVHERIDVYYHEDTTYQIVIECGENLLPTISVTTTDQTLIIRNNSKCDWYRAYNKNLISVHVYAPTLRDITKFGSGVIETIDTIRGDFCEIQAFDSGADIKLDLNCDTVYGALHTGPADLTFSGHSNLCNAYSSGNGILDFQQLESAYVNVNNSGTNDILVWCTNTLYAQILSIGDVFLKGAPTVFLTDSGKGTLIQN